MSRRRTKTEPISSTAPERRREVSPPQQAGGSFVDGELVHRTAPPPDTLSEAETPPEAEE